MQNEDRLRDYLKRVTSDLRSARRELDEERGRRAEPLAIVGMGCRFPGGIDSPDSFWDALRAGRDLVGPFPADRGWDLERLFDRDPDHPGTSYTSEGAFLEDAAGFDAGFFEISPREALAMDPQQRLLLETSWEAMESAGLDPHALRGRDIGVFVGVSNQGYGVAPTAEVEGHVLTGTSGAVVSGRLAYVFGLQGPTATVDTMCSSSLVALHLAAQAIRAGECESALVGGAAVLATPRNFVEFSRQRGLAADGRCKPFSAAADGTGWGEAVGTVLIESLSAARREGHPVLAVLRGTAINSDGASNGLTAPNGPAQQRVIGAALRRSELAPSDVDVVETHGTGTELGDPIEAHALLAAYGRERDRPLLLGALKSATGHTQAASGVAALIKMVLALRHGWLPRILHLDTPSEHVDWAAGAIEPLAEDRAWPGHEGPRRAGISSFGGSGTNAHVILEEATEAEGEHDTDPDRREPVAWPLSARGPEALAAFATRLAEAAEDADRCAVAAALAARSAFEERAVVLGNEQCTALRAVAEGRTDETVVRGRVLAASTEPVFVFPGQGAQWAGMGRELLDGDGRSARVFAARLSECAAAVEQAGGPDVVAVLRDSDPEALADVGVVQPVSWAVMVALAAVWEDAGVTPAAVIGHSQGEIAAAVVAGALSVADGARVVTARALALRAVAGSGTMASLGESREQAAVRIEHLEGVAIAAVNGPSSVVIAGPVDGVEAAVASAESDGRRARRIAVDYASHTAGMEPLREPVLAALAGIEPGRPRVPWHSTHDCEWIEDSRADGAYWFANLRDTVRFAEGITALIADGFDAFLEVSPHPVLTPAITEVADAEGIEPAVSATLRRGEGDEYRMRTALAEAWVGGVAVDWARFTAGTDPHAVTLPNYPFQRQRFWLVPETASTAAQADPVDAEFWSAVADGDAARILGGRTEPGTGGADPETVLGEALPLLADWRRRRDGEAAKDGWRYRVRWHAHPGDNGARITGTWALFCPADRAGDPEVTRIRDTLAEAAEVVTLAVDPGADRDCFAARARTLAGDHPDLAGVVSLLAMAEQDHPEYPGLPLGVVGTLSLLQGLADAGIEAPLWALTHGAEAVTAQEEPNPVQAAVCGLGRVAALEHPRLWGGLADLPGQGTESLHPLLTVLADHEEDQVALRSGAALVRRLHRAPRENPAATGFRARGTALITGGTGGLGAHTARMLAAAGTEHLVLLSRSGPEAEGAERLRAELAALGPRVTIAACDVADAAAVTALVDRLSAEGETIRSVVHTAGVGILVPLADTTVPQFADGALGKLAGARILDELFTGDRGTELDHFVLFSSVAGLWGSGEHGAYSAANAVADSIAAARRARGLAGTSIPWGIWEASGGGMGQAVISSQLKWRGIRFMEPELAVEAMVDALTDGETLLAIADIDWPTFAPVFTAARRRPLLDGVPDVVAELARAEQNEEGPGAPGSALRQRLAAAAEPRRVLERTVRAAVAGALGFADPADVAPDRAFRELGVDSLTAVALRNRIAAETGVRLPVTVVFDHPTVAALAERLRTELGLEAPESSGTEPVAARPVTEEEDPIVLVGMACRFPGGIRTPEQLWSVLHQGADVISGFPTDRGWDLDALYDPDPDREGTVYTRSGGFLHDAAEFDPEFFGISPREALAMDPQQRLLLETSWEALERAGIDPHAPDRSRTGVFIGAAYQGYGGSGQGAEGIEGHMVTGMATSVASGRISYALGLQGPAVTIDTACSSSLVALHQACQALRDGDCERVLVGGAAVMVAPVGLLGFSRQRGLATDGRCKAFADAADGMGLAEGAGMLAMERLSAARAAGHPVLAVIRGTAINQDGASNGLSAPSGPAQQRVIRAALDRAGLRPDEVDAVEAHGTGTSLGDPIEAGALLATYGRGRDPERPLWLGSVKSNIGHTQAAAGTAGLIKMVLALRHGELPATLHAGEPSRHIDWDSGSVRLLSEARPWPVGEQPRRAGVSAFGVSGTNVHVIIEEPPQTERLPAESRDPALWPVSARTEAALDEAIAALDGMRGAAPEASEVAAVLARRTGFAHRAVLDAASGAVLARGHGTARDTGPVFVFPGQGAQWVGMGRALLEGTEGPAAAFAARFAECATALAEAGGPDAHAVLADTGESALDDVAVLQPVSWAVMVSLAALWESAGVVPSAVLGHSQGEIAAAVVAGALSVEQGARVVTARAVALRAVAGSGAMGSIAEGVDAVRDRLAGRDSVVVAAVNGPTSVVLSGTPAEVEAVLAEAAADGVRTRLLPVDYASHSPLMESVAEPITRELAGIRCAAPRVPWFSTLRAEWVDGELDADYWFANLRGTVRFADAVAAIVREGFESFVEVSPHPVLVAAVLESAEEQDRDVAALATLRRDEGDPARVFAALAEAWSAGVPVDWSRIVPGDVAAATEVPTYPFQRMHLWPPVTGPGLEGTGRRTDATHGWRHHIRWVPIGAPQRAKLTGRWFVLAESGAEDVCAALAAAGAEVRFGVPTDLVAVRDAEPDGLLYLPGTEPGGAVPPGVLGLAELVRNLGEAGIGAPLWCVTRGAVSAAEGDPVDEARAGVWGTGRIAAQELPDRWGGLLDLPPVLDERTGSLVAAALSGAGDLAGEDQLAVRGSGVLARRLVPASTRDDARTWTPRGTVLVTGGTGALAGHVARWLARAGADRIVLAGRRGPEAPGAGTLRTELAGTGAHVELVACDVTDREALARLLADYPPDAVVHTAGVVDDALITELDPERAAAVCAPKTLAAAHLDELTRDRELDAFVLFSSMAGALGGPGQGAYAAANASLDALAGRRRTEGLPATAIGWGAWAGAGLAEGDRAERMRRDGVLPMDPERAVAAMAAVVTGTEAHVVLADVDWARHAEVLTASRPLPALRGIPETNAKTAQAPDSGAPAIAGLDPAERRAAVLELVRDTAAAVLGLGSADAVPADRAFRDLGFDSLTAVDLRNRLVRATGARLPVTLVFDYPSAEQLAAHLLTRLAGGTEPAESADRSTARGADTAADPIAIVGMSCRLPGGVDSPEALWELLQRGGDAVVGFPADRGWDIGGRYHPDPEHPGTFATTGGGFLADPAGFDAEFFGISPREALTIDPQQRLLLETAWETFERAGIAPAALRGSRTGVFVGSNYHDYGSRLAADPGQFEGQLATGSAGSVASGRLAYTFGLQGPAVTVDTACSSSLVALHLAAQALRGGECSLALAGGVTVISSLDTFVEFSRQGALSPDGRCRAFAEEADGAGWAEGVGVLLLERLSDAEAAGHPVLAVLRGTAVNSDGASNGLTAPNGPAQQRVIRSALDAAGLRPDEVDAVEAHGTGTVLGDPIEAQALLATYGQHREEPLLLGSVKSNLGHTQAASGVAGVIKSVLSLRHGQFPATLHAGTPSSRIEWDTGAVRLAQSATAFGATGRPWRIGVSSFGISGTNAHVIVEGSATPAPETEPGRLAVPLPVSARSPESLRAASAALRDRLASGAPARALSAALRTRTGFDHRAVLLTTEGEPEEIGGTAVGGPTGILLSGQGAQRLGMGRELGAAFPVFAEAFGNACAALEAHLDGSVAAVAHGTDAEQLADTGWAQPALFAYQVAAYRLVESWGLEPEVFIGHSVGEFAAAHLSGALSLEDAARLLAARANAMAALPSGGGMAAITGSPRQLAELTGALPEQVRIAAINSSTSLVLTGPSAELDGVLAECAGQLRISRLRTSHAFHSALMAPAAAELAEAAAGLDWREPRIPVVSTHTGEPIDRAAMADPAYWAGQLTAPVRFAAAVTEARDRYGIGRWAELAPHPALIPHLATDHPEASACCLGHPETAEPLAAQRLAARLWVSGAPLPHWPETEAGTARAVLPELPTYSFAHRRYWLDAPAPKDAASVGMTATGHPLLHGYLELAGSREHLLTGRLSVSAQPWLADHALDGTVLLPGTAFVELAMDAAARTGADTIRELTVLTPLALAPDEQVQVQLRVLAPDENGDRALTVDARAPEGEWTRHAEGLLGAGAPVPERAETAWPPENAEPLPVEDLYARTAAAGFDYGPAFRGLRTAWRHGESVFAEVALGTELAAEAGGCVTHPALLDAALHTVALRRDAGDEPVMPFSVREVRITGRGATALRVRMDPAGADTVRLELADEAGRFLGVLGAVVLRPVPRNTLRAGGSRPLHHIGWATPPVAAAPQPVAVTRRVSLSGVSEVDGVLAVPVPLPTEGTLAERVRAVSAETLHTVQSWLALAKRPEDRLVLLTHGACAVDGEIPDPTAAAALGLVRAAQAEQPGRIVVLDAEPGREPATDEQIAAAVAGGEPVLAVREGNLRVPRLRRTEQAEGRAVEWPETVLVTGGTGALGAAVARHLVTRHGIRRLVLTGRRGPEAPGAGDLRAELTGHGAQVVLLAADLTEPEGIEAVLAAADGPIGAVVHTAGVIDDGAIESLTPQRFDSVLAPKVGALAALADALPHARLVLFSSLSGTLGGLGQANYSAANAALDALALAWRAAGREVTSIAWGLWAAPSGITGGLGTTDRSRLTRGGLVPMDTADALRMFDACLERETAMVVAARFDTAVLRSSAGGVPPVFTELVPASPAAGPTGPASGTGPERLAEQLREADPERRSVLLLDLVRGEAAGVLGHSSAEDIPLDRGFLDLGFDSLTAVELRNRLGAATGLRLPATVLFDHPDPRRLAELLDELLPAGHRATGQEELAGLRDVVAGLNGDHETRERIAGELRALLGELEGREQADAVQQASDDELFDIIDGLGVE
nr:type I polyketide synthase [Sciscionella sp. SE31]